MVTQNKIKHFMDVKKMRLVDLAERTGISSDILHYYVHDKKAPGVYRAIIIARALGLPVDEVFIVKNGR